MGRTIADVALLFGVASGHDSSDVTSSMMPLPSVSLEEVKNIPIGWFEDDGMTPVTEETRRAIQSARMELQNQGFRLKPVRPASLEAARKLWQILFVQCGAMLYRSTILGHEEQLSPTFKDFLNFAEQAHPLTADSVLHAWTQLDEVRSHLLREMSETPILLCPVCSVPSFRHGEREWQIDEQTVNYWDATRYTQWFNFLGSPAAVVPIALSAEGLPIAVQIAGLPFADEQVLTVAGALDRSFGFRPPPIS